MLTLSIYENFELCFVDDFITVVVSPICDEGLSPVKIAFVFINFVVIFRKNKCQNDEGAQSSSDIRNKSLLTVKLTVQLKKEKLSKHF